MKPKRQGRPPTIENARDRILDEAAHLFAREGYDGTSLGSLADSIGITKAAIYHYFPNKNEIYEGIIVRTLENLLSFVTAEIRTANSPEKALQNFMEAHATFFEENYDSFLTLLVGFGGMENVVMIAEAQKLRDEYEVVLRSIIKDGIKNGVFRKVDVNVTSRAVLSMLNWMVRWFKPGKARSASSFATEYCNLLLTGLQAGNPTTSDVLPSKPRNRKSRS